LNLYEWVKRQELGPRNGRAYMGMQTCSQGHTIKLPYRGFNSCHDCRDMIMDYAGLSDGEDRETENDIVTDPQGEEEDVQAER